MPSQSPERTERPIPIIREREMSRFLNEREATAEEAACLNVPTVATVGGPAMDEVLPEVRFASLCALALRDALVLAGRSDVAAAILQPHLWLLWCEMIGELWAPHNANIASDPERAHAALMPEARSFADEMVEAHDNWVDQRRAQIRAWFADRRADRVTLAAELLDLPPSAEVAERLTRLRLNWRRINEVIRLSGSSGVDGRYVIGCTPQGHPVFKLRSIN